MKSTKNSVQKMPLKLSMIAVALAGTIAGQAHAQLQLDPQTSFNVYARVLAGVVYQNNVSTANNTTGSYLAGAGNQWGTSWWGITGTHDFGGGVKAGINLEEGFSTPGGIGNGNGVFNRAANVYATGSAGTIYLGEKLTINNDLWNDDPMGFQSAGAETLLNGRSWGGGQANSIEYVSPNMNGFQATIQLGLGGVPGNTSANQTTGFELNYSQPNFDLRMMYDDRRDINGSFSSLYTNSKEFIFAGKVILDKLTIAGGYIKLDAPDVAAGAPSSADSEFIGVRYQLNEPWRLLGAVYHVNVNNGGGSANLYTAGVEYTWFKNTFLYATVGNVNNSSTAAFPVDGVSSNPPPAGQSQFGAWFGIGMNF